MDGRGVSVATCVSLLKTSGVCIPPYLLQHIIVL